jgi:hypothetical protein
MAVLSKGLRRCAGAYGPDPWLAALGCLHRSRSTGTSPQHYVLLEASRVFGWLCSGCCWHGGVLLTVHRGARPIRLSLYKKGGVTALLQILCRWTPSGAPVLHPLLRGSSIGPSSPDTWGCNRQCPSIPGVFFKNWPHGLLLQLIPLMATGSDPSAATATVACTCLTSAHASTFW